MVSFQFQTEASNMKFADNEGLHLETEGEFFYQRGLGAADKTKNINNREDSISFISPYDFKYRWG